MPGWRALNRQYVWRQIGTVAASVPHFLGAVTALYDQRVRLFLAPVYTGLVAIYRNLKVIHVTDANLTGSQRPFAAA